MDPTIVFIQNALTKIFLPLLLVATLGYFILKLTPTTWDKPAIKPVSVQTQSPILQPSAPMLPSINGLVPPPPPVAL